MKSRGILDGKVALITGGGRGIGRSYALAFANEGAKVVVNDYGGTVKGGGSDKNPAIKVTNEISNLGGRAIAICENVADYNSAKNIIDQAKDEFGTLDIVINNAGILRDTIFHKMTEEEWDSVLSVHLKGAFNISRCAAEVFRKKKSGVFVHTTSTSGLIGNLGQANYAAAKMGIVGLSKSIAIDMSRYNVRSNCISPFAWSRMIGSIPINDKKSAERVAKLKTMDSNKIAPLAVALCVEESNVTGQIFAVRKNEIFLMSQPRPLRSVHEASGWTPKSILRTAIPSLEQNFYHLDKSADVFSWDPI